MFVIPAIDIKGGRVVRLTQGAADQETVYADSPETVARSFDALGVELIHMVDLDGAFEGRPVNLDAVAAVVKAVRAKVELGGGMRDIAAIERALAAGVAKVVIGTKALDRQFLAEAVKRFGERLVVGIDARDGMVRTKGWVEKAGVDAVTLARAMAEAGVCTINYTDISTDGMLEGPNIPSLKRLLDATDLAVVAAGGISSLDDIKRLKLLERDGLTGAIVGKALYERRIDLREAVQLC